MVVGRYPDEKFSGYVPGELRTIDFFDADTGTYKYGLTNEGIGGIISLNRFNILGDTLASAMGMFLTFIMSSFYAMVDDLLTFLVTLTPESLAKKDHSWYTR